MSPGHARDTSRVGDENRTLNRQRHFLADRGIAFLSVEAPLFEAPPASVGNESCSTNARHKQNQSQGESNVAQGLLFTLSSSVLT